MQDQAETALAVADDSLEGYDQLLLNDVHRIRDAILGYIRLGLTQKEISVRTTSLELRGSQRTIQRHVSDRRTEGLLPAVEPGKSVRTEQRRKKAATCRQFGGVTSTKKEPPEEVIEVCVKEELEPPEDCVAEGPPPLELPKDSWPPFNPQIDSAADVLIRLNQILRWIEQADQEDVSHGVWSTLRSRSMKLIEICSDKCSAANIYVRSGD